MSFKNISVLTLLTIPSFFIAVTEGQKRALNDNSLKCPEELSDSDLNDQALKSQKKRKVVYTFGGNLACKKCNQINGHDFRMHTMSPKHLEHLKNTQRELQKKILKLLMR